MGDAICTIDDCDRRVLARGWCKKHYELRRSLGDPLITKRRPVEDRFWGRVDAEGDCWLWTGHVGRGGYGQARKDGRVLGAHRIAWEILVGPVPGGLELDHLCRVTRCVNPDHLEPVTPIENQRRGYGPAAQNRRKTHCPQGHDYEFSRDGHRWCRACFYSRMAERRREAGISALGRSLTCKYGHPYADNSYIYPNGRRSCRTCRGKNTQAAQQRRRAEREAQVAASQRQVAAQHRLAADGIAEYIRKYHFRADADQFPAVADAVFRALQGGMSQHAVIRRLKGLGLKRVEREVAENYIRAVDVWAAAAA